MLSMKALSTYSIPIRTLLGLASFWPIIYMPLFFSIIFGSIFMSASQNQDFPTAIFLILPMHLLTMIVSFALIGLFAFDIYKNERIEGDKKVLWLLILFFMNFIAYPVYWYLYIWKTPPSIKKKK